MKTIIVILVAFFTLASCNIMKKITGSKDDKAIDLSDKKEEVKKEEPKIEKKEEGTNEIVMKDFDKKDLPGDVKYQGNIVNGKRWMDKNGENIIILTLTKEMGTGKKGYEDEDMRHKELYAYQYVKKSDGWSQLWKVNDFVNDCPVDVTLEFLSGTLTITDLNHNGIGETTFIYKLACRGDVSPCDMKLIMHEGETKYAIRGTMKLYVDNGWHGGDMKIDKSFDEAPNGFLGYAKEQWNKYREEKLN